MLCASTIGNLLNNTTSTLTGLYRQTLFVLVVYGAIVAQNVFALAGYYDWFMAAPTWAILSLALVPIVLRRTEGMLQWFALAIVGVVFYGYFLAHLTYLYGSPEGLGLLLFVVLMTQLSDALQFLYGKAMGRRRWTPISPNKTVEGLVGGLILPAIVASFLLEGVVLGGPPDSPLIVPGGALGAAVHGLVLGLLTVISDLSESLIKRSCDVKDSGTLFGESGGFFDVVDSLLLVAPILLAYTALAS